MTAPPIPTRVDRGGDPLPARRTKHCVNCGGRIKLSVRLRVCTDCRIAGGYGAGVVVLLDALLTFLGWWL